MRIVDPYATLLHHTDAVRAAMQSDAAAYIRFTIAEHLADLEDNDEPDNDFTRGMRMGLRVAYCAAGGIVDGSKESWDAVVEAGRG